MMAISVFPSSVSVIKSIQRGSTASAGAVTIASVNTAKTFVRSFSNGSAGTVATDSTLPAYSYTGSVGGTLSPTGGNISAQSGSTSNGTAGSFASYSGTRSFSSVATGGAASGGTANLTIQEYGVTLTNATTLTATGACFYEVVEYN